MNAKSTLLPASIWLLTSACGPGVATPMPEPPSVFDLSGVNRPGVIATTTPEDPAVLQILAASGTVPPGSVVHVTNLDGVGPVAADGATPQGSFEIDMVVHDGEELRFEWLKDGERSAPADALISRPDPLGPAFTLTASPRFDCLKASPGFVLDFSAASRVTLNLENGCAATVSLANPRSRVSLTDFALPATLSQDIAAGQSAQIEVDFTRGAAGVREDVLFIDVSLAGTTLRYPITLWAE